MGCIPPQPSAEFVYRMEDGLEVDRRPYDPERPVVCRDETSRQLVGAVRGPLPPRPGEAARYDGESVRNGTATVFVAFEPLAGWRQRRTTDRRCRRDWAAFVKELADGRCAGATRIVLVMDQLNTHTPASLYETFPPEEAKRLADRLEIHHTPKHGSWLNLAAIEFSALARSLPERVGDKAALERHAAAWEHQRNAAQAKADWQFTTADARVKLRKLYPSLQA
jgi:DDE superfamily endonuclease